MNDKATSTHEVYKKMAALCSRSEQCSPDIRKKIVTSGLNNDDADEMIEKLKAEKFIDDERFIRSYISDKFKINQWGRIKIRHYLKMKGLPDGLIQKELDEMDENKYRETLIKTLKSKARSVKKKNKIMLIDDNPGDAILLREALKMANLGVDFEAFQSGKEALKQLNERYDSEEKDDNYLPDLIILDLNMPGLNGLEVIADLKNHTFLRYIPVVMMTTSSLPADAKECLDAGSNSVIVKPMDFDEYVKIINLLIDYWFKTVKRIEYV